MNLRCALFIQKRGSAVLPAVVGGLPVDPAVRLQDRPSEDRRVSAREIFASKVRQRLEGWLRSSDVVIGASRSAAQTNGCTTSALDRDKDHSIMVALMIRITCIHQSSFGRSRTLKRSKEINTSSTNRIGTNYPHTAFVFVDTQGVLWRLGTAW